MSAENPIENSPLSDEALALVENTARSASHSRHFVSGLVGSKVVHASAVAAIMALSSLEFFSYSPPLGQSAIEISSAPSMPSQAAAESSATITPAEQTPAEEPAADPRPVELVSPPLSAEDIPLEERALQAPARLVAVVDQGELAPSESQLLEGEIAPASTADASDPMTAATSLSRSTQTSATDVPPTPQSPTTTPLPRTAATTPPTATAVVMQLPQSVTEPAALPSETASTPSAASTAAMSDRGSEQAPLLVSLYCPEPSYPPELLVRRITATVKLRLKISEQGNVASATVVQSSGYPAMDKAAVDAVLKWRFEPARRLGMAVAIDVIKPFRFEPKIQE